MRLIDTETGEFTEFFDLSKTPPYAILSHTWNPPPVGEQTYQDVVKIQEKCRLCSSCDGAVPPDIPPDIPRSDHVVQVQDPHPFPLRRSIWDPDSGLSEKIRRACAVARRDGYRYIWIDSSCIDKTSSSELSEAINSMFNWYRHAQICYAFLSDIPSGENVRAEDSKFRKSRWFKRSWTLQELIAPPLVVFLAQDWEGLGTKDALAELIEEITYIDRGILAHARDLADESVAERMRWASGREATRVEDEAYSLLGIFGISMPTLYGEGTQAFQRLQEEILQRIPDQSLFAWGSAYLRVPEGPGSIGVPEERESGSLFASSPRSFVLPQGKTIISTTGTFWQPLEKLPVVQEYTPTPHGLRTQLCLLPFQALGLGFYHPGRLHKRRNHLAQGPWYLAILACELVDGQQRSQICKVVCCVDDDFFNRPTILGVPHDIEVLASKQGFAPPATTGSVIFTLSWSDIERVQTTLQRKTVYLLRPQPSTAERRPLCDKHALLATPSMSLSSWTRGALQAYGYTVSELYPAEHHPRSFFLTLYSTSFLLRIQYEYEHTSTPVRSFDPEGDVTLIVVRIWVLSPGDADSEDVSKMDAVQRNVPYTSVAWAIRTSSPWAAPIPLRRVHLVVHSGDEVLLQLGLGVASASRYHVHVEVVPPPPAGKTHVPRPPSELSSNQMWNPFYKDLLSAVKIQEPHDDLKFTMLGSVRQTLEKQGYTVYLEGRPASSCPTVGNSHSESVSLVISDVDFSFTISVKYFYSLRTSSLEDRRQDLIIVARVILESSSGSGRVANEYGSATYQDGPYAMVWEGSSPWRWWLGKKRVGLATPAGGLLTLELGLDLAWRSGEYYLHVNVERHCDGDGSSPFYPGLNYDGSPNLLLRDPHSHSSVRLTFPGHVKRTLEAQEYQVHFEEYHDNHPADYRLTLSDAHLTIIIDYSHHLSTGADGKQALTFLARVKALSLRSSQDDASADPAAPDDGQLVQWDAWQSETDSSYPWRDTEGWRWSRATWRDEDHIKLTGPTGQQLTLSLGFYLVWPFEYCFTVEIVPTTLSPTMLYETLESPHIGMHNGNNDEDTGGDAGVQETAVDEVHDVDVPNPGVVAPIVLSSLDMPVETVEVEGADSSDVAE